MFRACVPDRVAERFLRDAIQHARDDARHVAMFGRRHPHAHPGLLACAPREVLHRGDEAEVVEHRRAQSADRGTRLAERQIHQFAGHAELFGSHRGIDTDGARCGIKAIGQRDEAL